MPYARKRVYRKRRVYKKRPAYKKRSTVSNTIKRYVKRTIHSQIENKTISDTYFRVPLTTFNYANTMPLSISAIPYGSLAQTATQAGRIGNEIKVRKLEFNSSDQFLCFF